MSKQTERWWQSRVCDHMLEIDEPVCYLGLHFPYDCAGCSRYVGDAVPLDVHREWVWREFAGDGAL